MNNDNYNKPIHQEHQTAVNIKKEFTGMTNTGLNKAVREERDSKRGDTIFIGENDIKEDANE